MVVTAASFRQSDGDVFLGDEGDIEMRVEHGDIMVMLQVALTALRVHGTEEERVLARKVCASHLGR